MDRLRELHAALFDEQPMEMRTCNLHMDEDQDEEEEEEEGLEEGEVEDEQRMHASAAGASQGIDEEDSHVHLLIRLAEERCTLESADSTNKGWQRGWP